MQPASGFWNPEPIQKTLVGTSDVPCTPTCSLVGLHDVRQGLQMRTILQKECLFVLVDVAQSVYQPPYHPRDRVGTILAVA
jgi:hypothetical protein